jgi:hypothetical protein
MGEEELRIAGGAEGRSFDAFCPNSSIQQLASIRLHQVQEDLNGQNAMSRRAGGKKEHRILLPNRVRLSYLVKQSLSIAKLRMEIFANLLSYRIATRMYAGANRGFEIARPASKETAHFTDTFLHDPLHRPTPASVEDPNGSNPAINHNDRQTVGSLNP